MSACIQTLHRLPMKRRFQRYIVHTEILSTFHTLAKYISLKNWAIETIGQWRKQPQNPPLSLEPRGPHSVHQCPLTTPNDSTIGSCTSTQLCNKFPIGCNDREQRANEVGRFTNGANVFIEGKMGVKKSDNESHGCTHHVQ